MKAAAVALLFSLQLPLLLPAQEKTPPYGSNAAAGSYYELRGFRMYCEIYGKGEPLLIVHGNGGSIKDFSKQIAFFSEHYRVIVADSRAQGRSTDTGDSLSYEMMADDLAALLEELRIDSARVIGWSDGGINGLLLAIRHPKKVKQLAITGANLRPDTTAVYPEVLDIVRPLYSELKNKSDRTASEKKQFKLIRLLIEAPHISLSALQKITCPVLVIGGDHDVIREEHTLQIYQHLPKAYLWILPNAGHSTPLVYPDDFNRIVNNFFQTAYRRIEKESRFN